MAPFDMNWTPELKNKLSTQIDGQLPDFIAEDHPKFSQFLKSFYKFLEAGELQLTVNIDNIGSHLVFSYLMLATENINIAVIPHIKDKREEMSWTIPDIDIPPELNEFLGCSSEYSSDENNTFNFMSIGP